MVQRIGHRGAPGHAPENTLASFRKALELDVDVVECDVATCKTGELVVSHDLHLFRLARTPGFVTAMSLEELRSIELGNGEPVPMVREVLDLIDRDATVLLELKWWHNPVAETADLIREYIEERGWEPTDFRVASFNPYLIHQFEQELPQVPTSGLVVGIGTNFTVLRRFTEVDGIGVHAAFLRQAHMEAAEKHGLTVWAYTMFFQPRNIQELKDLGVDGIAATHPEHI